MNLELNDIAMGLMDRKLSNRFDGGSALNNVNPIFALAVGYEGLEHIDPSATPKLGR